MKLFSLSNTFGLASLCCTLASAKITIEALPPVVYVGEWYHVKYTSDRTYHMKDFRVMHWDEYKLFEEPTREMLNHHLEIGAGESLAAWKVPNMENGVYDLLLSAIEVDEHDQRDYNASYYVNSNDFMIVGGHVRGQLRPKQVAGIVFGTVVCVALLAGIWVAGARLVRKRESLAVDLSDQNDGGYTDDTGR